MEKRIRKNARVNKLFSRGDRILVLSDISEYLLKGIIRGLPVKIFKRKRAEKEFIKVNKINKIVASWTMDDEIASFLKNFFCGEKEKEDRKTVKLLKVVGDKELLEFSKINGIRFVPNKKDKELGRMIEHMTKKYPDTKEKLLNSAVSLENMGI